VVLTDQYAVLRSEIASYKSNPTRLAALDFITALNQAGERAIPAGYATQYGEGLVSAVRDDDFGGAFPRAEKGPRSWAWMAASGFASAIVADLVNDRSNGLRSAADMSRCRSRANRLSSTLHDERDIARRIDKVCGLASELESALRRGRGVEMVDELVMAAGCIYGYLVLAECPPRIENDLGQNPQRSAGVLTTRRERLTSDLIEVTAPAFEGLITEARRMVDDAPQDMTRHELQLLQADLDTWLGQTRSPEPDVVIMERVAGRVLAAVYPTKETAALFEASGLDTAAAQGASERLDDVVESTSLLGSEDALTDVAQANVVQEKQAELERYVAENLTVAANTNGIRDVEMTRAGRMAEARTKGWEKFWSDVLPVQAGKLIAVVGFAVSVAMGKVVAVLRVVKALLRFFSSASDVG
jgi:hypothetical protein